MIALVCTMLGFVSGMLIGCWCGWITATNEGAATDDDTSASVPGCSSDQWTLEYGTSYEAEEMAKEYAQETEDE
jgi:hypothetical protein